MYSDHSTMQAILTSFYGHGAYYYMDDYMLIP